MVSLYPNTISIKWKMQPTQDANGDWVEGVEEVFISPCRAEANGEGKVLTGEDGSSVYFSFAVYLPRTNQVIPYGANVEIKLSSNHVVKGSLKNQSNGQLNTRLWV